MHEHISWELITFKGIVVDDVASHVGILCSGLYSEGGELIFDLKFR